MVRPRGSMHCRSTSPPGCGGFFIAMVQPPQWQSTQSTSTALPRPGISPCARNIAPLGISRCHTPLFSLIRPRSLRLYIQSPIPLFFHILADPFAFFFALTKNSTPLFSNDSTRLQKNGGVGRVTMLFPKPKLQLTVPSLSAFLEGGRPALSSFLVSLPPYFLASLPLPVTSPQKLYHSTL